MACLSVPNKSSMLYIWRLLNDPPSNTMEIVLDEELIEQFQYLDALADIYTDVLATRFQRMLVNKRAVKENIGENIYVLNSGGENRVIMDLQFTSQGHCVETENNLAMYLRTNYKTIVNHTVMYGKNRGKTFTELLNRKLSSNLNKVSNFVQNKLGSFLGTELFQSYADIICDKGVVLIQATLVNHD